MKHGIWILILILSVAGCSLKPDFKKVNYYTLDYQPKIFSDGAPCTPESFRKRESAFPCTLPAVIRFERFKAAPMIESADMVYRHDNFQADSYVYHKWRAAPADMVTYFFARDFRESSLFSGIFATTQNMKATHRIEGTVEEFYELDEKSVWEAELSVNIVLITENEPDVSKRVLFQKQFKTAIPCRTNTPQAFAEAMSIAMSVLSEMIIADVYERLAEHL